MGVSHRPESALARRRGMTVLEVLLVIILLGVLAGLWVGGVTEVERTARQSAAETRLADLAHAVEMFRARFDCYPAGSLVLKENGEYDPGLPSERRHRRRLREIWPSMLLAGDHGFVAWDFNRDGDCDDVFRLNGSKCLLFFLYGVPEVGRTPQGHMVAMMGAAFSTDPHNPFLEGGLRHGPFHWGLKPTDLRAGGDDDSNAATPVVFYEIADPRDHSRSLGYKTLFGGRKFLIVDPTAVTAEPL